MAEAPKTPNKPGRKPKPGGKAARADRLAGALRANLAKRKDQARVRGVRETPEDPDKD